MQLRNGKISIFIKDDKTTIEITDGDASLTFCKIQLTPEQLSRALSGGGYTECKIEVRGLDNVGCIHECQSFSFLIPPELRGSQYSEKLHDLSRKALAENGMKDWTPDGYYNSQDSFFSSGCNTYARVTIRRWVVPQ